MFLKIFTSSVAKTSGQTRAKFLYHFRSWWANIACIWFVGIKGAGGGGGSSLCVITSITVLPQSETELCGRNGTNIIRYNSYPETQHRWINSTAIELNFGVHTVHRSSYKGYVAMGMNPKCDGVSEQTAAQESMDWGGASWCYTSDWASLLLFGKGTTKHCAGEKCRRPSGSAPDHVHCHKLLFRTESSIKYM